MSIELIAKITPKNSGFTGMVDANQVLGGGASGVLPDETIPDWVSASKDLEDVLAAGGDGGAQAVKNVASLAIGTATLDDSAIVQIDSTTKGFLPPRMTTTQREAISTPAVGSVVYDTTIDGLYEYKSSGWAKVGGGSKVVFDFTDAAKITTVSCAQGAAVSGSIALGISDALAMGTFFRVVALSDSRSATIELFANAAMTVRLYLASPRDCYTTGQPYHVDSTPFEIIGLVGGLLYYRITNASRETAFTIEIRGEGPAL